MQRRVVAPQSLILPLVPSRPSGGTKNGTETAPRALWSTDFRMRQLAFLILCPQGTRVAYARTPGYVTLIRLFLHSPVPSCVMYITEVSNIFNMKLAQVVQGNPLIMQKT